MSDEHEIPTRLILLLLAATPTFSSIIGDDVFNLYENQELECGVQLSINGRASATERLFFSLPSLGISAAKSVNGNFYSPAVASVIDRFFSLRDDLVEDWLQFQAQLDWCPIFVCFLAYLQSEILRRLPFDAQSFVAAPSRYLRNGGIIRGLGKTLHWGYDDEGHLCIFMPIVHAYAQTGVIMGLQIKGKRKSDLGALYMLMAAVALSCEDAFTRDTKRQWEVFAENVKELR